MRFLIYIFLLIGALHVATLFGGPIMKNHMLEGKMISLSKERPLKDDHFLLKELASFIDDNNIDLEPQAITIQHTGPKQVVIGALYDIDVKFLFLERDYHFTPSSANLHPVFPDFARYLADKS